MSARGYDKVNEIRIGRSQSLQKDRFMFVDQQLYRKAFQEYLRKGTPIEWSIKQERPTTHHIWRTRDDEKVRSSHAANDGQVFAWDDPPPTGHPGEDYECRCTAEPYYPESAESLSIVLQGVSDSGTAWGSRDFVRHYYQGGGRGVSVRETGNLARIIARYMEVAEDRIKRQIAEAARKMPNGGFSGDFVRTYDMTGLVFSIGDTTIGGAFSGRSTERNGVIAIFGDLEFYLEDEFADPLDIGVEAIDPGETIFENLLRPLEDHGWHRLGLPPTGPERLGIHTGEPYAIKDTWSGRFEGQVLSDPEKSDFR